MRYLSVCSGIEAATAAWHPLGWTPVGFSEIEKFPAAVLAHHYPGVPNLGDMTRYQEWPNDLAPNLLVGGTPCQSFSVAGLRKGLDDPRGNLMLTFGSIARRYRPEWLVWENVPGVLSSNGGRDFGTFLGMLAELGYGFAYRVLDAQFFGVAQRRRRVFVVANARDWRRAAAVLFERASLRGDPAPSREARQDTAGSTGDGVARCLTTGEAKRQDWETRNFVAHSLRGEGFDAGEDGTGRGQPYTLAIRGRGGSYDLEYRQDGTANALLTPNGGRGGIGVGAVAIRTANTSANGHGIAEDVACTLDQAQGQAVATSVCPGSDPIYARELAMPQTRRNGDPGVVQRGMHVRRLTPRECECLQGFPDNYTRVPWRGKPASECPDGPRYKALGNSMAVPVMRWIGERIAQVSAIEAKREAA